MGKVAALRDPGEGRARRSPGMRLPLASDLQGGPDQPVPSGRAEAARALARRFIAASVPRSPDVHLLATGAGEHVFLPDGSRLFDADARLARRFAAAVE